MVKNAFRVSFVLFVVSTIALTGYMVGPFSLRIPFGILTGFFLLNSEYKIKIDTNIKILIGFSLAFFIALCFNGELISFNFFNYFIGKIVLGIVMYYGADHYFKSQRSINKIILVLSIIAILNGVSSILQYYKNPLGDILSLVLSKGSKNEGMGFSKSEIMSFYSNAGKIGVPGIFQDRVANGYFAAFSVFLPLFLIYNAKSKLSYLYYIVLFLISFITLYFTQQRSALAIVLLLFGFLFIHRVKLYNIKVISVILLLVLAGIALYINLPNGNFDTGRYNSYSDDGRDKMYFACIDFIFSHFLFGGPMAMAKVISSVNPGIVSPHNFFLTAYGYSGFVGGSLISILFLKMLLKAIRSRHLSFEVNVVGCMLLAFLLNSLLHNGGLMEGEGMIWFLFVMLMKIEKFKTCIVNSKKQAQTMIP
jgi:hypothetical protein